MPVGFIPRALLTLVLIFSAVFPRGTQAAEETDFVSGSEFTTQLNRPLLASLDYSALRPILRRLAEDRKIAIWLDRRLDPRHLVLIDLQADYFDTGISDLVREIPAEVVIVADTVFVTAPETARTLRTRIALADQEFKALSKTTLGRQLDVARRATLSWSKLSSPREILQSLAARYDVTIENVEIIPHDLWAAGALAHANFLEAFCFLTAQFDLELQWIDAHHVRIGPQRHDPVIEQEHVFRGRTKSQVIKLMQDNLPELKIQASRDRMQISGLVEQHEFIEILLGNRRPRKPSVSVANAALANRRFTLQMVDRPFLELVEALEKQGIHFNRHERLLEAAHIDLNQRVSVKLENATIETLMSEVCAQLQLAYEINDMQIDLTPAKSPGKNE